MIPILFDKSEINFTTNGLGRLHDCISCVVTEERNGIYECDFEYPVSGEKYDLIRIGNIIGVTHDDVGDLQPFDIVSYSKPIDGIVTFHCTHVSYRQSYMTVTGANINSLADAFTMLSNAEPTNTFTYWTDKNSSGYLGAANGIPHSVRQILGGIEGSILDSYGGEYEWDKWSVKLWAARGTARDFSIRYGVNMIDYNEEYGCEGTYSSCVPYWTNGTDIVVGDRVDSGSKTATDRGECVPLDLSNKFETAPTKAQLEAAAASYMATNNTFLPGQNINVEFVRLQDSPEFANYSQLLECNLCDTINVIFPGYQTSGAFKIVKIEWDVLENRYISMELGELAVSLSEALGLSDSSGNNISAITEISRSGTTAEITAPANGTVGHTFDISSLVSGYTGWVICYCNTQSGNVLAANYWHASSTTVTAYFRNLTASDVTTTAQLTILRWK